MQKILIGCLMLLTGIGYSQARTGYLKYEVLDPNTAGKIFKNPLNVKDKPVGSPYLMKMFAPAKVENIAQNTYMRYNVYNDEFEFITPKNDTLILDKIEDFGTITLIGFNKKYKLTTYTTTTNKMQYGYLIETYNKGNVFLYKKENIDFYEAKKAKTTLERDMPARYTKTGDTFFLKIKDAEVSEFPDGKKELIKRFPDKKSEIETWLKANKVSFKEPADILKIVDFIATL